MGMKTPKLFKMLHFSLFGKMFCLCGGIELRELKPSQVQRHTNADRYI